MRRTLPALLVLRTERGHEPGIQSLYEAGKDKGNDSPPEPPEGTQPPANSLILELWTSEPYTNTFVLFQPPCLWWFVRKLTQRPQVFVAFDYQERPILKPHIVDRGSNSGPSFIRWEKRRIEILKSIAVNFFWMLPWAFQLKYKTRRHQKSHAFVLPAPVSTGC